MHRFKPRRHSWAILASSWNVAVALGLLFALMAPLLGR
jgi:hypothetical protein